MDGKLKITVLSGAGISAESGVATFRDKNGLWQKYNPQKYASIEGWREDPEGILDFYTMRRQDMLGVEPNEAHYMLAELEKLHEIRIITQNIDNLHERAGSENIIHLHGELTKVTSSTSPLDSRYIEELALDIPLKMGDKAKDGSQLRPFIVWFGEGLRESDIETSIRWIEEADIFVVIGTSLSVYPAAGLIAYTNSHSRNYYIDPANPAGTLPSNFTHIKKTASKGIEELMEIMRKLT